MRYRAVATGYSNSKIKKVSNIFETDKTGVDLMLQANQELGLPVHVENVDLASGCWEDFPSDYDWCAKDQNSGMWNILLVNPDDIDVDQILRESLIESIKGKIKELDLSELQSLYLAHCT